MSEGPVKNSVSEIAYLLRYQLMFWRESIRGSPVQNIRNTVRAIVVIRYISQVDNAIVQSCGGDGPRRGCDNDNAMMRW